MYDIEVINTLARTVDYSTKAVAEYEAGLGDRIEEYTDTFEIDYITGMGVDASDDIGGLIVYLKEGKVFAVYDYENFCGWVL
jgi:hypothetical protein